jgi:hypothetical protein
VNILIEMIGDTLPENWTERVLCPVYKKGDNLYRKNNRGIFAKVLHSRILPYANAIVKHLYQAEIQPGNLTTNQL